MKAVVFEGTRLTVRDAAPPELRSGWALLRVRVTGICRTDIEITRGYMNFSGILGHEFMATVADCEDEDWIDRRVVGEINVGCGECAWCRSGLARHCPHRSTLGISHLDGCMAEYVQLPVGNLHHVPDALADDEAVFTEPLAAAFEILDQVPVQKDSRCIVVGDGKLGILCAWALSTVSSDVTLIGRHPEKLARAEWNHVRTATSKDLPAADIVVEATGRPDGFGVSLGLCKPRGVLVLKSTIASRADINLTPVVVNEITMIGSRCGRFERALAAMVRHHFPVTRLISARYPLEQAVEAFRHAEQPGTLKVLLDI